MEQEITNVSMMELYSVFSCIGAGEQRAGGVDECTAALTMRCSLFLQTAYLPF